MSEDNIYVAFISAYTIKPNKMGKWHDISALPYLHGFQPQFIIVDVFGIDRPYQTLSRFWKPC